MRTTEKIMVEKNVTTYKCDFCDRHTKDNSGCCGSRPIMQCSLCKKDMCSSHREWYQEDSSSDYYDAIICPDCNPAFKLAWEHAKEIAMWDDSLSYIATNLYNEMQKGMPIEDLSHTITFNDGLDEENHNG